MAGGALYFGYFLLGKQKKVTCRRSTTGIKAAKALSILAMLLRSESDTKKARRRGLLYLKTGFQLPLEGREKIMPPSLPSVDR
jgi:hypothetical protein